MDLSILSKLLNSVNSVNAFRENATVPIISFGNVGFFRRQQNISCFPMSSGDNAEGPDEVNLPGKCFLPNFGPLFERSIQGIRDKDKFY